MIDVPLRSTTVCQPPLFRVVARVGGAVPQNLRCLRLVWTKLDKAAGDVCILMFYSILDAECDRRLR